ncbi:MAG: hypothetical protein ACRCSB_01400, partial [Bacteroidales bacterium]
PTVVLKGQKVPKVDLPSFSYPDTTRLVSSDKEAIWSFFGQENSGTDRYGFSLLPTGYGYSTAAKSYYDARGLSAVIGLANTSSATTSTGAIEQLVFDLLSYNTISPGFSGNRHISRTFDWNVPIRCVKP